jgi:acetyl-CoA carboxylase biotin carboxyl carrier protein
MAGTIDDRPGLLTLERIASLMDFMRARGVVAFRVRQGEEELEIRWPDGSVEVGAVPLVEPTRATMSAPSQTFHAITSPAVGTYFASSEPGKPPFVQVGQHVTAGQVVCVVESMKLMNEIEADVDGVVTELPVPNGGSVKAGEVVCLVRLDPQG